MNKLLCKPSQIRQIESDTNLSYFFSSIHLNMAPASGQQPQNTGSWPAAHNLL